MAVSAPTSPRAEHRPSAALSFPKSLSGRMRGRRREAGALEGLPLQFIIVMVVVALVVAGLVYYSASSDASGTEASVRAALQGLASRIEEVADPTFFGPANHTLVLKDGAFTRIEFVALGGVYGSPDPRDSSLRYRLSNGQEGTVVTQHRVLSPSRVLELQAGSHTLRLVPQDGGPSVGVYVNVTWER